MSRWPISRRVVQRRPAIGVQAVDVDAQVWKKNDRVAAIEIDGSPQHFSRVEIVVAGTVRMKHPIVAR